MKIDAERAPRWRLADDALPPVHAQCFVATRSGYRMAFWRPGPIGSGRVEWCDFHTGQPWIGANDPNEPSEKIVVWMNLPDLPSLESAGPARWSRETNRAYAQNRDPRGTERQL